MAAHAVDVGDADFETRVIEESRSRPVVVDFWAPWCGPCRSLTPMLERLAEEGAGRWLLAKVNTDEHPGWAQKLGVRGIPALKGIVDGELVDELAGLVPEEQLRRWIGGLVPSPAAEQAERAAALLVSGSLDEADAEARAALEAEPRLAPALLVRARVALKKAAPDDAAAFLDQILDEGALQTEVERTRAEVTLARAVIDDEPALRQRLEKDADDEEAAVGVAAYEALAGDRSAAFERLLALLRAGKKARAHPLALAVLGFAPDEEQREMRRKLSAVLF